VAFFTVITPTFNRPDLLNRAVESVLNQEFKDFEYLIVNNYSLSIVNKWNDSRIRILDELKPGANNARNQGINQARGKFICFLDDDDEYYSNHLLEMHRLIISQNEKVALYRTLTKIESEQGEIKIQPYNIKPIHYSNLDHIYTTLIVMNCVCCHHKILHKLTFKSSIPIAQDYHLWTRIVSEFPLIESPEVTTIYHQTPNSTSSTSLSNYFKYIEVFSNLFQDKLIQNQLKKELRNDRLFKYHYWILMDFGNQLSFIKFLKVLLSAIKLKPTFVFSKDFLKSIFLFLKPAKQLTLCVV